MNNQQTPQTCEWVELYVLGGLDDSERKLFEQHLSTCPHCQAEVAELQSVLEHLPLAAEPVAVPAAMKQRVLGQVLGTGKAASEDNAGDQTESTNKQDTNNYVKRIAQAERKFVPLTGSHKNEGPTGFESGENLGSAYKTEDQHNGDTARGIAGNVNRRNLEAAGDMRGKRKRNDLVRRAVITGVSAAAVLLGLVNIQLRSDVNSLQELNARLQQNVNSLQGSLEANVLPARALKPDHIVKLDPAAEGIVAQGLATIVIDNKGTHLVVQAEKLPELKNSEAFQVWLIKGEEKVNAGTFLTRDGKGALYYTFEPRDYDTVAITLEPDTSGNQPRGTIVLASPIKSNG
ncbi:anti-sigma factor [Paenibacillus sp. FJAT-26967]|uniref:anti-sigma factor n=1 Tax=Paenibacillus sp. FJAT-26967 TaxID=1729690 RepID=UPI000837E9DA|nr:anti-sigma factor [Paenibacillus sp. FJAT-26967]